MKVEVLDCPAAEGRGFPCSCGFIHFVGWDWKGSNNNVSVCVCVCVNWLVEFVLLINSLVLFSCPFASVLQFTISG